MIKKNKDNIEIYEDVSYYKIYGIIGIITIIASVFLIYSLLTTGNTEYIGTYIVCCIVFIIMILTAIFIKFCFRKIKLPPKIEMIITKEFVEFFSVKGTCESIKKIMISDITKVLLFDEYLVINSVNKNNEKEKYSYSFGIENSNLYLAERELKEILKQKENIDVGGKMKWKYVKELKDKSAIKDIEEKSNIIIPEDLKQIIIKYNGGRPEKNVFDTIFNKEKVMKSLISYNKDDKENIYLYTEFFDKKLLPFAITEFGDIVCYNKNTNEVELYLHEQDKCEKICDNILEFFDKLYI